MQSKSTNVFQQPQGFIQPNIFLGGTLLHLCSDECQVDLEKQTVLSYLCSSSRMDRITPDVDGFCCTVARKVNSLLFRNSWVISHSHEGLRGSLFLHLRGQGAGRKGEGNKKYRWEKRRRGIREGKGRKRHTVNAPSGSQVSFPFALLVNSFHFRSATHHSWLTALKAKPGNTVPAIIPTCHFDKSTINQSVIFLTAMLMGH